jgi:multidrug efflux pump subunit AcrA (membrane-fusion protein)
MKRFLSVFFAMIVGVLASANCHAQNTSAATSSAANRSPSKESFSRETSSKEIESIDVAKQIGESASDTKLVIDGAVLKTVEVTSVAAQVAGVLKLVHVREGDRVHVGASLGIIDSKSSDLQLERSKVALDVAQKNLENTIDIDLARKNFAVAENEYARALESNKVVSDVYPAVEVERLKLVRDRAELEVSRAQFMKEIARLEVVKSEIEHKQLVDLIGKHTISSPVSGMVVALEKRTGEWVEPGAVTVRIVEIDRLRIEGFLNAEQADMELLHRDANVELVLAGKPMKTTAKLVFISPEVNPINSQVRVFLDIDNSDGKLRPGLRPRVWFSNQATTEAASSE